MPSGAWATFIHAPSQNRCPAKLARYSEDVPSGRWFRWAGVVPYGLGPRPPRRVAFTSIASSSQTRGPRCGASLRYSTKLVEGVFCELRPEGVLRSSLRPSNRKDRSLGRCTVRSKPCTLPSLAKQGGSLTPSFLRSKEGGTYEAHRVVVERGDHNDGDAGDECRASVRCPRQERPALVQLRSQRPELLQGWW